METQTLTKYPKRLIKVLFGKYITQDRIPMPTSLEGKSRWVVSKVIKKDVKALKAWSYDHEIYGDHVQKIAGKLIELYFDANVILNENVNERATNLNVLHKLKEHEVTRRP